VAVIFETEKVDFVFSSLKTAVTAKAKAAGVESADEEGAVGFENETRSFSCHLAKLNGAVVVSNSARQLERILAVEAGKVPALGETGEYRFFRHRYPIAAEESAYVFISDACLRSWAGPRVRIAASRRSRALAALGSLTSARISGEKLSQKYEPLPGKVRLFGDRVFSERYGSQKDALSKIELWSVRRANAHALYCLVLPASKRELEKNEAERVSKLFEVEIRLVAASALNEVFDLEVGE